MSLRSILILSLLLLVGSGAASAETIRLKNGRTVVGAVLNQNEKWVWVRVRGNQVTLARDSIASISADVDVDAVAERVRKQIEEGRALIDSGRQPEAEALLAQAVFELEGDVAALPEPSEYLEQMLERLIEVRGELVGGGSDAAKAQELYLQARAHIDKVDYKSAYEVLKLAAVLDPDRIDIRLLLSDVAQRMNDDETAMEAFSFILRTEPQRYYDSVSADYLRLLLRNGRRLIVERKPREALKFYKEIILLQPEGSDEPVPLEEFEKRLARREQQSEDEVLLDVFAYADRNNLVDLALVALEDASRLRPDDVALQEKLEEYRFLARFRELVDKKDFVAAALFLDEATATAEQPDKLMAHVKAMDAGERAELDAARLFGLAREAHNQGDFERAILHLEKLLAEFPTWERIDEAKALLQLVAVEGRAQKALQTAHLHIRQWNFGRAEEVLLEAMTLEGITTSRRYGEMKNLAAQMPTEKQAADLWFKAEVMIQRRQYSDAIGALDTIVADYPGTFAAEKADYWLTLNRGRLLRQSDLLDRMAKNVASWISLLDQGVESEQARDAAWMRFEAHLDEERLRSEAGRESGGLLMLLSLGSGIALTCGLFFKYSSHGGRTAAGPKPAAPGVPET